MELSAAYSPKQSTYIVKKDDYLRKIIWENYRRKDSRDLTRHDVEVILDWLCAANRKTIGGNPNLIFPNEKLLLGKPAGKKSDEVTGTPPRAVRATAPVEVATTPGTPSLPTRAGSETPAAKPAANAPGQPVVTLPEPLPGPDAPPVTVAPTFNVAPDTTTNHVLQPGTTYSVRTYFGPNLFLDIYPLGAGLNPFKGKPTDIFAAGFDFAPFFQASLGFFVSGGKFGFGLSGDNLTDPWGLTLLGGKIGVGYNPILYGVGLVKTFIDQIPVNDAAEKFAQRWKDWNAKAADQKRDRANIETELALAKEEGQLDAVQDQLALSRKMAEPAEGGLYIGGVKVDRTLVGGVRFSPPLAGPVSFILSLFGVKTIAQKRDELKASIVQKAKDALAWLEENIKEPVTQITQISTDMMKRLGLLSQLSGDPNVDNEVKQRFLTFAGSRFGIKSKT